MNREILISIVVIILSFSLNASAETFSFTIPDAYLQKGKMVEEPVLLQVF